ncbi:MAG: hypothetical protein ACLQSR_04340, partial [Limisphaerales bacterium]
YYYYVESNYQAIIARRKFLADSLPPDEKIIGYFGQVCDIDECGIWLSGHRAESVLPGDSPESLRNDGIHYVVLNGNPVNKAYDTIWHWMDKYHGTLVASYVFPRKMLEVSNMATPPDFYIVKLD